MLDALHGAGIEIVSPNFMNTRTLAASQSFIPARAEEAEDPAVSQEDVAFDKAELAASIEQIRTDIEAINAELQALTSGESADPGPGLSIGEAAARLEARKEERVRQLKTAEALSEGAE
jgi:cell division protein FtsB